MSEDVLKVQRGDLAALSFRAHEGLRRQIDWADGRVFREGEAIVVVTRARVTRSPSGALIFGDVQTEASKA